MYLKWTSEEVYCPFALFMGCGVVERHLEMAEPTTKDGPVVGEVAILSVEKKN